jgi:hypothetical protein
MNRHENPPANEKDPRLQPILEQYGEVLVINHKGDPQSLAQAVNDCPPFEMALLNAGSPEQLELLVQTLKAPE